MRNVIVSMRMLIALTVLTGAVYPLLVTMVAQSLFSEESGGSLISKNGVIIGSRLISQKTESDRYFWPRPSAVDFNPIPSGGSNYGPTAKKLKEQVMERAKKVGGAHGTTDPRNIPQDLLFASGSGLDPEISVFATQYQIQRIAKARQLDEAQALKLRELVDSHTRKYQLGMFGEPRINVLVLNLAMDAVLK